MVAATTEVAETVEVVVATVEVVVATAAAKEGSSRRSYKTRGT